MTTKRGVGSGTGSWRSARPSAPKLAGPRLDQKHCTDVDVLALAFVLRLRTMMTAEETRRRPREFLYYFGSLSKSKIISK